MDEFILAQYASAALFVVTGALVLVVTLSRPSRWSRVAALASLVTVSGAGTAMMMSYTGEAAIELDRAGPIKRRAAMSGERGYFEFADEEPDEDAGQQGGRQKESLLQQVLFRADDAAGRPGHTLKDCPHCPELVIVQSGYFRMGAPASDGDATPAEHPGQVVRIAQPFAIGRHEVTVAQYLAFAKATGRTMPVCDGGDLSEPRLPITCVSWHDAKAYAGWLSATTDLTYRLPSEAEWEHAARAGSAARYTTGHELRPGAANVGAGDGRPERVGRRSPNGFGLHDVHGNVAEMVQDCWVATPSRLPSNGAPRAARGGCSLRALRDAHAGEPEAAARVSARRPIAPDVRHSGVGFRVVRELR